MIVIKYDRNYDIPVERMHPAAPETFGCTSIFNNARPGTVLYKNRNVKVSLIPKPNL